MHYEIVNVTGRFVAIVFWQGDPFCALPPAPTRKGAHDAARIAFQRGLRPGGGR